MSIGRFNSVQDILDICGKYLLTKSTFQLKFTPFFLLPLQDSVTDVNTIYFTVSSKVLICKVTVYKNFGDENILAFKRLKK